MGNVRCALRYCFQQVVSDMSKSTPALRIQQPFHHSGSWSSPARLIAALNAHVPSLNAFPSMHQVYAEALTDTKATLCWPT